MNCVGQRLVKVGWVIDAASLMVYCFRLSRGPEWLVEDVLMIVCLCRLIDSDDLATEEDLKTRILEDDSLSDAVSNTATISEPQFTRV